MSDSLTIYVSSARRSRWGCQACRTRRKKCDEERPSCQACVDRRIPCVYSTPKSQRRGSSSSTFVPLRQAPVAAAAVPAAVSRCDGNFVAHFHSTVAGLISFAPCGTQNPFFAHVLPLVSASPLVRTAVEAVAAAHLHGLGTSPLLRAQTLQLETLRQLSDCVRAGELSAEAREQLITASLLLIYYEVVLGSSVRAARCHLRGAKALLDTDPSLHQGGQPSARMGFLCKVFLYFDVMIALSLSEAPLGLLVRPPIDADGADDTFGLTGTLWPMMQRLAELLARHHQGDCVSFEAAVLEHKFRSWTIERADGHGEPPTAEANVDAEAMMQIAQTYKYSSLLTLYSSTVLDRQDLSEGSEAPKLLLQETYRRALDSLLRVCVLSGTMSTLTWPLYTVALQARSPSDRTLVQQVFMRLQQRQHMRVVEDARRSAATHWGREQVIDMDTTQATNDDAAILLG